MQHVDAEGTNFDGADLTYVDMKDANVAGARLVIAHAFPCCRVGEHRLDWEGLRPVTV